MRKESTKTIKEKEALWDEIDSLNQQRQKILLDSTSETVQAQSFLEIFNEIRERKNGIRDLSLNIPTVKALLRAIKKYGCIEETLSKFRQGIATSGYTAIEREMISVISIYGTARDKAVLIALGHYEAKGYGTEIVTEKETKEIRNNVSAGTVKEIEIYSNIFLLYETIKSAVWMYKYSESKLRESIACLSKEIIKYKGLLKTKELFDNIAAIVPAEQKKKLDDIIKEHAGSTDQNEQLKNQWQKILKYVTITNRRMGVFKGCLQGLENWMEERNASDLMQSSFRADIKASHNLESDIIGYNKYLMQILPTEEDKHKIILNTYHEATKFDISYKSMLKFLNEEYERRDKK